MEETPSREGTRWPGALRNSIRVGLSVGSFVLFLIGTAGLPGDLAQWREWSLRLLGAVNGWIVLSAVVLLMTWLPYQRMWHWWKGAHAPAPSSDGPLTERSTSPDKSALRVARMEHFTRRAYVLEPTLQIEGTTCSLTFTLRVEGAAGGINNGNQFIGASLRLVNPFTKSLVAFAQAQDRQFIFNGRQYDASVSVPVSLAAARELLQLAPDEQPASLVVSEDNDNCVQYKRTIVPDAGERRHIPIDRHPVPLRIIGRHHVDGAKSDRLEGAKKTLRYWSRVLSEISDRLDGSSMDAWPRLLGCRAALRNEVSSSTSSAFWEQLPEWATSHEPLDDHGMTVRSRQYLDWPVGELRPVAEWLEATARSLTEDNVDPLGD